MLVNQSGSLTPQQPTTSTLSKFSKRHLARDPDSIAELIEQIHNSDDESDDKMFGAQTQAVKKNRKFFHKSVNNSSETITTKTQNKMMMQKTNKSFKRKKSQPRNTYEFLSESTDLDATDPAADIIQKLIKAGKVRVATSKKGTGKPVIKKQRRPRAMGQRKHCTINPDTDVEQENHNPITNTEHDNCKATTIEEDVIPDILEFNNNDDDDLHNDFVDSLIPADPINTIMNQFSSNALNSNKTSAINLASTVMKSYKGNRRNLLDSVRKLVSTPNNQQATTSLSPLQTTILSPIKRQTNFGQEPPLQRGFMSPWRAPDDAQLPKTFSFGRNSANLPSFSSDFIPSTPRKSKRASTQRQDSILDSDQCSVDQTMSELQSLNDSNGENLPPTTVPALPSVSASATEAFGSIINNLGANRTRSFTAIDNEDDNNDIENICHLPNPRCTRSKRSPLKAINILDVIMLPSWKNARKQSETTLKDTAVNTNSTINNTKTTDNENIFGFEEYCLDSLETPQKQANSNSNSNINTTNKITLHQQLKSLKKLRPADNELPLRSKPKPTRNAFDDDEGNVQRQRCIKEMLCSTMIRAEPEKSAIIPEDTQNLFKDPNPQSAFDEKKPRRTYVKPFKKKRKLRHHSFVMFMDSDESDNEEIYDKNNEEEINNPLTSPTRKKKRMNKEPTVGVELNEFVKSFNEMCKEVDDYQLVVEKSA